MTPSNQLRTDPLGPRPAWPLLLAALAMGTLEGLALWRSSTSDRWQALQERLHRSRHRDGDR